MMIRPATPADLPAIAALHAANWRADYAGLLPDEVLGAPVDARMAQKWHPAALEGPLAVLVARDVPVLLGFVAFDPATPDGLYVDALHVAAARRGFGTGAALLGAVAGLARGRSVWLEVLEGNHPARAVYAAWGGVEGPVFDDRVLGASVPARRVTWPDGDLLAARLEASVTR